MAWKFLSIGKANTEIERLREENENLKRANDAAKAGSPESPPAAAAPVVRVQCDTCTGTGKCAECEGAGALDAEALAKAAGPLAKANAQLDEVNAQLQAARQTNSSLVGEITNLKAQLTAKDQQLAAKDSEVKVKVAAKVVDEQARLGQPPLPAAPAEASNSNNGQVNGNGKELSGRPRILQACRTALESVGYVRKQN